MTQLENFNKQVDPKYDLEERTARFGEECIRFCKKNNTRDNNGSISNTISEV
jgi:hypothetical protein